MTGLPAAADGMNLPAARTPDTGSPDAGIPDSGRAYRRYIDWIWQIRGSVALPAGQSSDEAFDRLDPLFRTTGTSHDRAGDTLVFTKKDPAAQDKLSIYDEGVLWIEPAAEGPVLRFRLVSRILLFCFFAPLMFVGVAQLTIALGKLDKPPAEAAKKPEPKKPEVAMNPIDKLLGAPAPDSPAKKAADKAKKKDKKYSPTTAYVFAGIFAFLYVAGRLLEDWLIRRQFRRRLDGTAT